MHERKVYQAQRLLASGRESVSLPLGTIPLMFAAIVGELRMVKMLVQGGADISASVFGFNALTIAVPCGNDAVVRYLYKASPVKCEETFQTAKKLICFSNGIHPNTVDLVFHGKNTLKKKRNLFSKYPKILGRKKVQNFFSNSLQVISFVSFSDREMSTKTEEWNPKESAKRFRSFSLHECWQRIADDCGDEVCKVLNEEGIDFESFLLLRRDDFEEMFLGNACVDTFEGIQESLNRGRVVDL